MQKVQELPSATEISAAITLVLCVPGLYTVARSSACSACAPVFPAIEKYLARARRIAEAMERRTNRPASGLTARVAALLQSPSPAASSALPEPAWLALLSETDRPCPDQPGRATPAAVLFADPVALVPGTDSLTLMPPDMLALTGPEADDLIALLNREFRPEGVRFMRGAPVGTPGGAVDRWYALFDQVPRIATTPLATASGRDITHSLPTGLDAARIHRLFSDAQLLLHTAPSNTAREEGGRLPVNSLWFSGEGSPPACPDATIWTNDDTLTQLATAMQATVHPVPEDFMVWASQTTNRRHGPRLICLSAIPDTRDESVWRAALTQLENNWLAPAMAALRAGTLDLISLVSDTGDSHDLDARALGRWWRLSKRLGYYA